MKTDSPARVRNGFADIPRARGDRHAGKNHKCGEDVSTDVDANEPQQLYRDEHQGEYEQAVNLDNAMFDYERAKSLVLDLNLPARTGIGMKPAADCLTIGVLE